MLVMTKKQKVEIPKRSFEPQWVHFQIQDEELWNRLQEMVKAHQGGTSGFMRWLIAREWTRRGNAHWVGRTTDKDSQEEGN
jgi:hypothetical protein